MTHVIPLYVIIVSSENPCLNLFVQSESCLKCSGELKTKNLEDSGSQI